MKVIIYTDGACSGNPGPGGWAAILMCGENKKEISGGVPAVTYNPKRQTSIDDLKNDEVATTSNRMELQAAIEGLAALKFPCEVKLYSDSAYLVNAFNEGWIYNWRKNGWRKTPNAEENIKNADQWERLYDLTKTHKTTFIKVKGHSDNEYNNRCDLLARQAIELFRDNKTHTNNYAAKSIQ